MYEFLKELLETFLVNFLNEQSSAGTFGKFLKNFAFFTSEKSQKKCWTSELILKKINYALEHLGQFHEKSPEIVSGRTSASILRTTSGRTLRGTSGRTLQLLNYLFLNSEILKEFPAEVVEELPGEFLK